MIDQGRGSYLGTVIDGKWWKRYMRDKMFARGSGRWRMDDDGLYFQRFLTKNPLMFPFAALRGVSIANNHAGRYLFRQVVIRLEWMNDGLHLSSGLVLARDPDRTLLAVEHLRALMPQ